MAVSVSPIKIISDLGYDPWEIESDEDYLRALKEATNEISIANPSDGRISMLMEEVRRVRADRKAADPKFKARKTKINVGSFLGRDAEPQKLLGPSKDQKKKTASGGLVDTIDSIAEAVGRIENTLIEQKKLDEVKIKNDKQVSENLDRDNEESRLGKVTGFLKKAGDKIIAPVQGIFSQIFGFIKKLILGKIFLNIIKWFGNPANQGKIDGVIKFFSNNWKKLLSLYLVFGTGIGKFVRFITKVAIKGVLKLGVLLAKIAAAKGVKGARGFAKMLGGKKGALIATGVGAVTSLAMYGGVNKMLGGGEKEEPQKFNKGGEVPGSGNTDTVPAMLTPGEFVMSKGAVQKYGTDTMESMNAAAGGTNRPTEMSKQQQIMRQTDSVGTFGEAGSSISTSQATPEEMKEKLAAMGMPSMELWDGSVVPNFGKMGADSFMSGIQMVREGMADHPDKIKILDDFMATNPYAQPEKLQSMINRVVPGSTEQVYGDMGDSISASAKKSAGYNKGGLVQHFNKGGLVEEYKKLQMESRRIKPGPNGKFSKEDSKRKGQLTLQMKNLKKEMDAYQKSTSTPTQTPVNEKKKSGGGFGLKRMIGGAADQLTGNLFDFDKRSGGGLIRKTAGALARPMGGLADMATGNLFDFDNKSGGGLIRKTANALGGLFGGGENKPVSPDKVMAKEPKIKQIKIPAEGLDSLLIKIASKQDIKTPVGQPSLSGPKITVMQENKSINTPMNEGGADGGKAIPNFNVGYGSARKMKQLGISR